MPYYQNALYGRGVPTYAEQLSPLADVFKAFAPNPARDLQLQGYASNVALNQMKGRQIDQELSNYNSAADEFLAGNEQGTYASMIRAGSADMLKALPGTMLGAYSARAIDDPSAVNPNVQATLAVGAGENYANTQPGFTADQSRQLQQNENTVGASILGHQLQAGVGHEGNRLRYDASVYGADQGRIAKEFDTLHDYRKTAEGVRAAAVAKATAPKLDKTTAGAINDQINLVSPGVDPETKQDLGARATYYLLNGDQATRGNPAAAAQRAASEVFGDAQIEDPWMGDPRRTPLPVAKRPALPVAAPPVTAVAAVPPSPAGGGGAAPVIVNSPAELQALPSGTLYRAPDGSTRRKG